MQRTTLEPSVEASRLAKFLLSIRRLSARGSKDLNLRGGAVSGASTPLRLIAGLVARAIDIVNGNTDNPTRFFETELEARDWIASRRVSMRQDQGVAERREQ